MIHCHLKPLVNFYEDDLLKKMKQGWCVLCDLKPVDSIGRELDGVEINVAGDGFDGKLIGTVEWDGKRFEAISKEHLDLEMFLTILKIMLSTHGEKGTQELIELVIEEGLEKKKSLQLLKQMLHIHGEKDSQLERLELEKLAEWKVNFLAWTVLFSLLVILGVFIRYVNSSFDGLSLCCIHSNAIIRQTDLVGLGLGYCGAVQLCLHVLSPHRWLCLLCLDQEGLDIPGFSEAGQEHSFHQVFVTWICLCGSAWQTLHLTQIILNGLKKVPIFTLIACCHSELAKLREGVP